MTAHIHKQTEKKNEENKKGVNIVSVGKQRDLGTRPRPGVDVNFFFPESRRTGANGDIVGESPRAGNAERVLSLNAAASTGDHVRGGDEGDDGAFPNACCSSYFESCARCANAARSARRLDFCPTTGA